MKYTLLRKYNRFKDIGHYNEFKVLVYRSKCKLLISASWPGRLRWEDRLPEPSSGSKTPHTVGFQCPTAEDETVASIRTSGHRWTRQGPFPRRTSRESPRDADVTAAVLLRNIGDRYQSSLMGLSQ
ncbi:hypothetical protein MTP99_014117 [Tenebrio molitor]|nr:hypothetical protein MTP99_014117 [Tenebrio molitor]